MGTTEPRRRVAGRARIGWPKRSSLAGASFAVMVFSGAPLAAQQPVDSALAAAIASIRAIDDHAHPLVPDHQGVPPDSDYDALPLAAIPPFPLPARLDINDPVWASAWQALYHYPYHDSADAHGRQLLELKHAVFRTLGDSMPAWALDQMGTDVMIANRISMGAGLRGPRFRWLPYDDALLFPLNTADEAAVTPDVRSLYPRESRLLRRDLADLDLHAFPRTLDEYLARVVTPTLERQKQRGAVGIKFELAYLRPLDIGDPSRTTARAIYALHVAGTRPSHADYKSLEDFLFRYISREAGRLGLPVQIHCTDIAGGYYHVGGSDPLLLESVFNDSTLRGTRFILLHGGWPQVEHTLSLLAKPNVYVDLSLMNQMLPVHTLAAVLRLWLDEYPEKVLYGSDAFADHNDDLMGWPEGGLVAARTTRQALGVALTAMMRDGDISRARAVQLAQMVLRDNALAVYRLEAH